MLAAARGAGDAAAGAQRHRRGAAHQPRPGAAVRRRGRGAWSAAAGYTDVEFDLATGRRARRGRGALAALAARRARRRAPCTWSTTAPPRWCWPRPRWPPAARSWSAAARWSRSATGSGCPTCWQSTGARLREVGTTNRTTARRLRRGDRPGHRLRPQGAPVQLPGQRLHRRRSPVGRAGRRSGVPVVVDIGSGLLAPDPLLPDEPDAATRAARRRRTWSPPAATSCSAARRPGCCSADADLVERLRRHPLARALRVDKLTLAALEATLRGPATPTGAALHADPAALRERAERLRDAARPRRASTPRWCRARPRSAAAARPGVELPSVGAEPARARTPRRCAPATRRCVGRVERGRLPARPALRARRGRRRPSLRARVLRGRGATERARRRHRRARRPRQVHAGPGADRDGARPLGRGAPPRHDHRPRLRLDDAAVRRRRSRSSTCPATSGSSPTCWPGSARCRRCCSWSPPTRAGCRSPPSTWPRSTRSGVRHGLLVVTRADLADPAPALAQARARAGRGRRSARCDGGRGQRGAPAPARRAARRAGPARRPRCPRPTPTRRCGCGSTGRSPSGAAARSSPAPWPPARCASATSCSCDGDAGPGPRPADARRAGRARSPRSPGWRSTCAASTGDRRRAAATRCSPRARWPLTDLLDVRLPATRRPTCRPTLMLHVGSAAVPVRVRPLGDGHRPAARWPGRCRCASATGRCCATRAGTHVAGGVRVLDCARRRCAARGAAAARAAVLAGLDGRPDLAGRAAPPRLIRRRRRCAAMGVPAPADAGRPGDWLVDPAHWRRAAARSWPRRSTGTPRGAPAGARAAGRGAAAAPRPARPRAGRGAGPRRRCGSTRPAGCARPRRRGPARAGRPGPCAGSRAERLAGGAVPRPGGATALAELGWAPGARRRRAGRRAAAGRRRRRAAARRGRRARPGAGRAAAAVHASARRGRRSDTTRRVAVPLLELLDGRGLTRRGCPTTAGRPGVVSGPGHE